jgi:predicted dehydrogenase
MIKVGIIGYGYWGPNLARNIEANPDFDLVRIADRMQNRHALAQKNHRHSEITDRADAITCASDIDVVVIATPVTSHFPLAMEALENGKHVWIEKPITASSEEAEKIIEKAESTNKVVMVDHTYLFTGAVQKIKEIIDNDGLGDLYYYDSVRVNLGLFQHDVNVIWDLATHDLSIMNYLLGSSVRAVSATGVSHFNKQEDIGYLTFYYDNNLIAHFNVNWLSPVKIRKTLIGGSKKMLAWNDLEQEETIKIYDKGVKINPKDGVYDLLAEYRMGDMLSPNIQHVEALKLEVSYFAECIKSSQKPHNDAVAGLNVVKLLEASDQSLRNQGAKIRLD